MLPAGIIRLNRMRKPAATAILLSAAITVLLAAPRARANVEMTLRTERTTVPVKGMQTVPLDGQPGKETSHAPVTETLHVTLGTTWLQWTDGTDSVTIDYKKRRRYSIEGAIHRLTDESLYALVAGAEAEMENRAVLGEAMAKGNVKDNLLAIPLAEHELSMRRDAGKPSAIQHSEKDGIRRYTWNGKELAAWSTELLPLAPAARPQFLHFIRSRFFGHPDILADLERLEGIPKWLRISNPMLGESTRIDVGDVKTTDDARRRRRDPQAAERRNPIPKQQTMKTATSEQRSANSE